MVCTIDYTYPPLSPERRGRLEPHGVHHLLLILGRLGVRLLDEVPVKLEVVLVVKLLCEEFPEQVLPEVGVIRDLVEPETSRVVEISRELLRVALTQCLYRRRHLLLGDLLVFLLLRRRFEALPREGATHEVHEDVAERLQVVPAALFHAQVGVNTGVAGGAGETLALLVRNVGPGAQVTILFGKSVVDEEEFIALAPDAHEEVVWFDVSVDEVLVVYVLDAGHHLVGEHQHRLQGERPRAEVEQVLHVRSEQVRDEYVISGVVRAEPAQVGHADAALEYTIQFTLKQ